MVNGVMPMSEISLCRSYLIKEAIASTSFGEAYLIVDALSKRGIATVDEITTTAVKAAKLFFDKAFLPLHLEMRGANGKKILDIARPASLFGSVFTVYDSDSKVLCRFKQKLTFLSPLIRVEDANNQLIGLIRGDFRFKSFKFASTTGEVISTVTHYVDSIIKAAFTTADDYKIEMLLEGDLHKTLITLAAAICIDFLYHEA